MVLIKRKITHASSYIHPEFHERAALKSTISQSSLQQPPTSLTTPPTPSSRSSSSSANANNSPLQSSHSTSNVNINNVNTANNEMFNEINIASITGVLSQISILAIYTTEMMDGIFRIALETSKRIDTLTGNAERVFGMLEELEGECLSDAGYVGKDASVETLVNFSVNSSYKRKTSIKVPHIFTRITNDDAILAVYNRSLPPPSLRKLDKLLGGGDSDMCMLLYSNPRFFFEEWLKSEMKRQGDKREEIKKRRGERKEKRRVAEMTQTRAHAFSNGNGNSSGSGGLSAGRYRGGVKGGARDRDSSKVRGMKRWETMFANGKDVDGVPHEAVVMPAFNTPSPKSISQSITRRKLENGSGGGIGSGIGGGIGSGGGSGSGLSSAAPPSMSINPPPPPPRITTNLARDFSASGGGHSPYLQAGGSSPLYVQTPPKAVPPPPPQHVEELWRIKRGSGRRVSRDAGLNYGNTNNNMNGNMNGNGNEDGDENRDHRGHSYSINSSSAHDDHYDADKDRDRDKEKLNRSSVRSRERMSSTASASSMSMNTSTSKRRERDRDRERESSNLSNYDSTVDAGNETLMRPSEVADAQEFYKAENQNQNHVNDVDNGNEDYDIDIDVDIDIDPFADPIFTEYKTMKRINLPEGAIRAKMVQDDIDFDLINLFCPDTFEVRRESEDVVQERLDYSMSMSERSRSEISGDVDDDDNKNNNNLERENDIDDGTGTELDSPFEDLGNPQDWESTIDPATGGVYYVNRINWTSSWVAPLNWQDPKISNRRNNNNNNYDYDYEYDSQSQPVEQDEHGFDDQNENENENENGDEGDNKKLEVSPVINIRDTLLGDITSGKKLKRVYIDPSKTTTNKFNDGGRTDTMSSIRSGVKHLKTPTNVKPRLVNPRDGLLNLIKTGAIKKNLSHVEINKYNVESRMDYAVAKLLANRVAIAGGESDSSESSDDDYYSDDDYF